MNFVDGWYRTGDLGHLDEDSYLHIHGRVVDCAEIDGRLVTPTGLQDLLCRRSDVRYAVIVPDPDTATRIAAVLSWPGQTVDTAGCLDAIAGEFGPSVASTVVVLPVGGIRSPSKASRTARRSAARPRACRRDRQVTQP